MELLHTSLTKLQTANLYRQLVPCLLSDATHISENGRQYLMLASNNYLGLTHHPSVQQAAIAAIREYGTGSGGSRLTTGNHPLYQQLESQLASFKGTEAALVFNTGYMANIGIISALTSEDDVIFSDALNHASIIDGCRLSRAQTAVYRHADIDHLASLLANTACKGRRLIVTDGVFSMDGDIAPLADIVVLARQHQAMVLVDDAHATGVIGPRGRGTAAYYGLEGQVDLSMGTLSKSLASEGGYVAGSRLVIDYLINRARSFIFSTALAPATVAAGLAALECLQQQPELVLQVNRNARYVREELNAAGFDTCGSATAIIPVLVGDAAVAVEFARLAKGAGLIVSAIRPPTVAVGTSRLRITVSAVHNRGELAQAVDMIIKIGRQLGVIGG